MLENEVIANLRGFNLGEDPADCKAKVASLKTQYNIVHFVKTLPEVIKNNEEQAASRASKVTVFKSSQEGGNL